MILYYITDRSQLPGSETQRRERLLAKITEAARCGIDYIQLREKDLTARELEGLLGEAVQAVSNSAALIAPGSQARRTRLLVNSRTDLALSAKADGVHLTSSDIHASDARAVWGRSVEVRREEAGVAPQTQNWLVAVSCHTPGEVRMAEAQGADFAVFAPVFEKVVAPRQHPAGLEGLRAACRRVEGAANVEGVGAGQMPVLALGGVNLANAPSCLEAGAAGIAAIRLFQQHEIAGVVERLRGLHGR